MNQASPDDAAAAQIAARLRRGHRLRVQTLNSSGPGTIKVASMKNRTLLAATLFLFFPGLARAGLTARQSQLLNVNCLQCHARDGIGVPLMGNQEDWKKRKGQGEDTLLRNAIQGVRGMPPLGYCAACTEEDLRALVRWVSGLDGGK